jgi:hypothetical protein
MPLGSELAGASEPAGLFDVVPGVAGGVKAGDKREAGGGMVGSPFVALVFGSRERERERSSGSR